MIKEFCKKHEKTIKVVKVAGTIAVAGFAGHVIGTKLSAGRTVKSVFDLETLLDKETNTQRVVRIGKDILKEGKSYESALEHISDLSGCEIAGLKVWFNED